MACPLLSRSQPPRCRAVSGGPLAVSREVQAGFCRGTFCDCPAYRYIRATGRALHPADFVAWVLRGLTPGRVEPQSPPVLDPGAP